MGLVERIEGARVHRGDLRGAENGGPLDHEGHALQFALEQRGSNLGSDLGMVGEVLPAKAVANELEDAGLAGGDLPGDYGEGSRRAGLLIGKGDLVRACDALEPQLAYSDLRHQGCSSVGVPSRSKLTMS